MVREPRLSAKEIDLSNDMLLAQSVFLQDTHTTVDVVEDRKQ